MHRPGKEPRMNWADRTGGPTKSFLGHLEDLRRVLLWAAASLVVGMIVAACFAPQILGVLKAPLRKAGKDPDTFLRTFSVAGGMNVALQTIFWGGLLLSLPVIVILLGTFIFPALTRRERQVIMAWAGGAVLMFVIGVVAAYLMLPMTLQVMFWFNAWMGIAQDFLLVTDYVPFVLILLASFGIMFELPIVLLILGHMGIVTSRQLRDKRRHAAIGILILVAVVTPTTDAVSMLIVSLPLVLLYEACIWIIWRKEHRAQHELGSIYEGGN